MAIEAESMRDVHAAQDQLSSLRQRMHIITDSNMNHCRTIGASGLATKQFVTRTNHLRLAPSLRDREEVLETNVAIASRLTTAKSRWAAAPNSDNTLLYAVLL